MAAARQKRGIQDAGSAGMVPVARAWLLFSGRRKKMRPINKEAVVELTKTVAKLSDELHSFNALLAHEQHALRAEERAAKWEARKLFAVKAVAATVRAPLIVSRKVAHGLVTLALLPFKRGKQVDVSEMAREPKTKKPRTRRAKAVVPAADTVETVTA